jgi:hypothetical protein
MFFDITLVDINSNKISYDYINVYFVREIINRIDNVNYFIVKKYVSKYHRNVMCVRKVFNLKEHHTIDNILDFVNEKIEFNFENITLDNMKYRISKNDNDMYNLSPIDYEDGLL